jgi:hypothetical protein
MRAEQAITRLAVAEGPVSVLVSFTSVHTHPATAWTTAATRDRPTMDSAERLLSDLESA